MCLFIYIYFRNEEIYPMKGGAKTVSKSMSFYSLPHVSFYSSGSFIELADLLRLRVAIAKVFSCTLHSKAVPFLHVCSQVPPQSKVGIRRKGRLTIPEGLFISVCVGGGAK